MRTWAEADPMTASMLDFQDAAIWFVLALVFSVAALAVLNTMLMAVFERTRELGLLRGLGMSGQRLVALVMAESLFLSCVATAAGLAVGLPLCAWLQTHGLGFRRYTRGFSYAGVDFEPVLYAVLRADRLVAVVAALFLLSALATLWPAWRASRLLPAEAMRSL